MEKEIEILIDKYFNGTCSAEEESFIKEYFLENVGKSGNKLADYFKLLAQKKEINLPGDFETKLQRRIDTNTSISPIVSASRSKRIYWYAAAASIVLLFGIWFISQKSNTLRQNNPEIVLEDTYTSPDEALKEIKKSLFLVSTKIDKGVSFFEPKKVNVIK